MKLWLIYQDGSLHITDSGVWLLWVSVIRMCLPTTILVLNQLLLCLQIFWLEAVIISVIIVTCHKSIHYHKDYTRHSHFIRVKRKQNICYLNSSGVTKHETLCFQHFTTLFGLFEDCCFFDSTFIDEWRKFYHFLHMTCSTLVSWL